jgi:hypothetical protein
MCVCVCVRARAIVFTAHDLVLHQQPRVKINPFSQLTSRARRGSPSSSLTRRLTQ